MKINIVHTWLILLITSCASALVAQNIPIVSENKSGAFPLSTSGKSTPLYTSSTDWPGVHRAAKSFQADMQMVTGALPELKFNEPTGNEIIIIGTIGKSTMVDQLIQNKKLDVTGISGKWETFLIQVIENPFPEVKRALVVAGSDKRGTIFGIYEMSKQIGVSPWYWWADVPPKKNSNLFVVPGRYTQGEPAVKYRGIFINDEEPALGRWAVEKYGGFTHEFYEKVFELILRMKGNYLWPAMWWAAFNADDPLNASLADEYGIVMGTTHHEPMNRAHAEWRKTGKGPWNYDTNSEVLNAFWKEGIEKMGDRETIISLGMRGDGDMAMSRETNVALLEKIVKEQREMITSITKKNIGETPQLWALYKEVQDYHDQGMRTPDDVTLLLCDDNWGNIRKLPKVEDSLRAGSYGVYYHFDYVGGPRNYKWVNTNPISRVWEQMHLAYRYGANRIWIVNVGDIKPVEFPIEFFLDYAWNPELWNADNLDDYTEQWAARQFGNQYAKEIAKFISQYSKFNSRRKPELLSSETYSLVNYREAEAILSDYNRLAAEAEIMNGLLPAEMRDAYFQLVLHPIKASANLNELWITVAKNRWYAQQGRASANDLAAHAKVLFDKDAEISNYYNNVMSAGKWHHMMDQTHISYTYWQQPKSDTLPEVKIIELPGAGEMGVVVEGSENFIVEGEAALPRFDAYNQQNFYIDIFNRGKSPFNFSIKPGVTWVKLSNAKGVVEKEQRIYVRIDWKKAPKGIQNSSVVISQDGGKSVVIKLSIQNSEQKVNGFVESNGYVSIDAEHFSKAVNGSGISWKLLPDLGKTASAMTTFPVTATRIAAPAANSPHLEYNIYVFADGEVKVHAYFSPTLNFNGSDGLRYAVSIDDEPPQIINLHEGMSNRLWEKWVADNIIEKVSVHKLKPGNHLLKFWMVDPGVVLQKLVIETKELKPSYLGPPESYRFVKSQKK